MTAAQTFFQNRNIVIPDLDPLRWIENLGGGPVAARFYYDFLENRCWYESSTGQTRAIIEKERLLMFDLTREAEHQQALMEECRKALRECGEAERDPAKDLY